MSETTAPKSNRKVQSQNSSYYRPKFVWDQVKIHTADIPEEKTEKVVAKLNEAMDKFQIEKVRRIVLCVCFCNFFILPFLDLPVQDMATFVKKKCDEEFGGTWHCVVGRNFGCSITHDTKYVLFFQIDQMHVLLFKSLE